jgi:phosphoribosylformimino-5-aminoimidazole carboxamide ribotide isomerase
MMEIIPAIDLIDGACVRLEKGDFNKKVVYDKDPLAVAQRFEDAGIKRLHIVDLDGARGENLRNLKTLEKLSSQTSLVIDFGGGLKETAHLQRVFDAGAEMVSLGSVIVENPVLFHEWVQTFGADKFLPGADVLNNRLHINGWKKDTGIDVFHFIENLLSLNVTQIFCTDISKDGMLHGPAINLYIEILKLFPEVNLIASGGISGVQDLVDLQEAGCQGAIIGKAIYEKKITLKELEDFNMSNTGK